MSTSFVLELFKNIAFISAIFVVLIAFFLLFMLFRRLVFQMRQSSKRSSQLDLTDMLLLLQTMRGLLEEQKKIASQINKQIDHKMEEINSTVNKALENARELQDILEKTREQWYGLSYTKGESDRLSIRKHSEPNVGIDIKRTTSHEIDQGERLTETSSLESSDKAHLQVVADPTFSATERSLLDHWVGIELEEGESDLESLDIPSNPPVEPKDVEAARRAFRTLLNMAEDKEGLEESAEVQAGNGRRQITPLHARVYEYRDAGMTIAQIAKELGIGKGEVRLILSLRKSKG